MSASDNWAFGIKLAGLILFSVGFIWEIKLGQDRAKKRNDIFMQNVLLNESKRSERENAGRAK